MMVVRPKLILQMQVEHFLYVVILFTAFNARVDFGT